MDSIYSYGKSTESTKDMLGLISLQRYYDYNPVETT